MPLRIALVGGGIVGLSVARRLQLDQSDARITVLEKEFGWARHQTGRNSGVLHSGLYYPPGSLKSRLCRTGRESTIAFAEAHGVPYAVTGKLVVAASADELGGLARLAERGRAGGLAVTELSPAQVREVEPHVRCEAALHVAETGIIDFSAVCRALTVELAADGATLLTGARVRGRLPARTGAGDPPVRLDTTAGEVAADLVVNCAGLQADVLARRLGDADCVDDVRIVPFRGEYHTLAPRAAALVRGLVYPVPDPDLPFLGVHLTRGIDGQVHAGPNAVLALAREGYRWRAVSPRDLAETAAYVGFRRLAHHHWRAGLMEMARSLSTHRFGDSVRRILPDLQDADLLPAPAGVRAQAVRRDGSLVDDFLVRRSGAIVHVLNAPSPAATSAPAIARHLAAIALDG